MSLAAALHALACANALANRRLHGAACALPADAFVAPRPGFFPSLHDTLRHILVVDRFYMAALEGRDGRPEARATRAETFDASTLAASQAAQDRLLIALCDALDDTGLADTVTLVRDAGGYPERRGALLTFLFQHQTHHRGQAHAMLSHAGAIPPQLDEFLLDEDADRRAEDLALLGLRETDLWRGA